MCYNKRKREEFMNTHYVPRLVLKKFSDRICTYNIKTGELKEHIKTEDAYSKTDFYDSETEDNFNRKVESQFGNLLANKLLKCEGVVELSRKELRLTKKFLLLSVLRSVGNEEFLQVERKFYDNLKEKWKAFAKLNGLSEQETLSALESERMKAPFDEKVIESETDYQYWMRTLNVILDTDGTPEEILKHPNKTYPAHRWATIISNGYLAFWDTDSKNDEFVITDIGMTSENEKGWNGITTHNTKKTDFYLNLLKNEKDKNLQMLILKFMNMNANFHENFQMFPISKNRMIVEIAPFYKFRATYSYIYKMPDLRYLTCLPNEDLFSPNTVRYVKQQPLDGLSYDYDDNDKYIYEIKKLNKEEIRYCNALFMDRINTYLGFSSLDKAVGSIIKYKKLNDFPYVPRVDYTNLYKIIEERFCGSLNTK